MELRHIDLDRLCVSKANMRHGAKAPDVTDLIPSVRARGVLTPLLVRENGKKDRYEIVAGRRRYFASRAVKKESGTVPPLPCAVMEPGDDAAALEASFIENAARLDPDPMTQFETFSKLVREGRSVEDIAALFGLEERCVRKRLALGGLLPGVRNLFREEKLDVRSVQLLTMASQRKQREWLKLHRDPEAAAPTGNALKRWLLGGEDIETSAALFPLDAYKGRIVSDLFGERCYFADPEAFWTLLTEAIAEKRQAYLDEGWSDAVVLERGHPFCSWEYEPADKAEGGKVYIAILANGEVDCREGWLTQQEARKRRRKENGASPARQAEISQTMQTYLALHRHAVARYALVSAPDLALRLIAVHLLCGSALWRVDPEPQRCRSEAMADSLAAAPAQAAFAAERAALRAMLDLPESDEPLTGALYHRFGEGVLRVLALSGEEVSRVLTFLMAETLEAGSLASEAAGLLQEIDPATVPAPDEAFFDLLRGRALVNAVLRDLAGAETAQANAAEPIRVQKAIMKNCLNGKRRKQAKDWRPRYFAFPFESYTPDGGGQLEAASKAALEAVKPF